MVWLRTMAALAGAVALQTGWAQAAVIHELPGGTALSFAGRFDSVLSSNYTRDYDGFTFSAVSPNSYVWTSAPSYNFGSNGAFAGPLMALNGYARTTFDFTFDAPLSNVLAEFNWNPGALNNSPLVISVFDSENQLLETTTIASTGAPGAPGFFGFGGHASRDIARLSVSGSLFGVRNLSVSDAVPAGAVPEPASWALMLTGFFGLGSALRMRKHRHPLAAAH